MDNFDLDLSLRPKGGSGNTSGTSTFKDFICKLESYKTKFKNLHWGAMNDTLHLRVDQFLDELTDFQDELSETGQGIIGFQFGPNDIVTTHLNYTDPIVALTTLKDETLAFHKSINSNPELIGLVNSVEGFMTIVGKFLYLFRIAAK
jgi:hypothetical protein